MAEFLAAAAPIPIAQLTPDLSRPSTRCIKAIVTLIWPYSSSNSSLKVLLAEPDFRLRRTRGQVRVQFSASSARAVFEAGIGSGDEILLGLDGVEWTKDESAGQTPGRSIDWELKFTERLVLKIQQNESDKTSLLNIDHPIPRPQKEVIQEIPEPELLPSPPKSAAPPTGRPGLIRSETNEWSSPAFIKRARVSYGSLFESGHDIFAEEDGTILGKGRKRTRFSRESGAWRYSSRSQSPEPNQTDEDMMNSGFLEPDERHRPLMTDEGCQTLGLEHDKTAESLADRSEQQGAAVPKSIVSKGGLGIQEVSAPELTGDPVRSEAPAGMPSPLIRHVAIEHGNPDESIKQQSPTENIDNALGSAKLDLVPSDTLPGSSPLERSDPIVNEATPPNNNFEIEDLYGLSPTADGCLQHVTPRAEVGQTVSSYDGVQLTSDNGHYKPSHHSENRQKDIDYPRLPSRSISPNKIVDTMPQVYPEQDMVVNHNVTVQSSPYFSGQFPDYPEIDGKCLHQQSEGRWDMHQGDMRSPKAVSLTEHKTTLNISMQNLSARHLSPGGIAMSRSQSGHSEMIDLTEDSDEEVEGSAEGSAEGSQTHNEEEADEMYYREGRDDDQVGDDEEGYDDLLYDEYGPEPAENEFDYDDGDHMRYPPGFHPIKYLAPGEVADDDEGDDVEEYEIESEEIEEENFYDNDDISGEEDVSHAIKRVSGGEAEVIDLLSSDDEDAEDENASRDPSESGESAAARINETNAMFVEKNYTEADSDAGNFQEEIMEDGYVEADSLDETQLIQFEDSAKPSKLDDLDQSSDSSALGEEENEDADELDRFTESQGITLIAADASDANAFIQDIQFDYIKESSATEGQLLVSYGGHDGASDGPDHLLMVPHGAEENRFTAVVNHDDVPLSGDVSYPTLPLIVTADKYQHFSQETLNSGNGQSRSSNNDQLPTPDATQLTAVMASDTSFGSVDSFRGSLDRLAPLNISIKTVEISSQQEAMESVGKDSPRSPIINSATDVTTDAVGSTDTDVDRDVATNVVTDIVTNSVPGPLTEAAPDAASMDTSPRDVALGAAVEESMIETKEPTPATPRRSKRISTTEHQRERIDRSPSINMDEPTTPDDCDASVELAMAALNSPSKQDQEEQSLSEKSLRVMLSRPLQTSLGNFTTLKLVRFNLEKKLDVLAIVTALRSEPQRAKGGLRHYHLRFNITDATIAPSSIVSVNIFRPFKSALPIVQPGECVLLRNFLVKSEARAGFALRSDDGSSWVVFKNGGEEEVRGPPVEYGDGERDHVTCLKAWYRNLHENFRERLEKANGDKGSDMGRSMVTVF